MAHALLIPFLIEYKFRPQQLLLLPFLSKNSFLRSSKTTSVGPGNTYQWFKDDVAITGATSQNYQANAAGKYSVRVDYGGCQANATIQLQEFKIVSIDAQATKI
jgi:hypothetical protein